MKHDTFQILAALAAGEADAPEILGRLRAAGRGGGPTIPTLYRRLKEALDRGWLEVAGVEAGGPGRPGQRYRMTPAGRAAARAEAVRWRALADGLLDEGGSP